MVPRPNHPWREPFSLFVLTGLLVVGIVFGALRHLREEQGQHRAKTGEELSAIGELKASQIAQWRRDRLADTLHFNRPRGFADLVRPVVEGPGDAEALRALQGWLGEYLLQTQNDQARLLDEKGRERLVVPAGRPPMSPAIRQAAMAAMASGRTEFHDFYQSPLDGRIYLKLLVPIPDARRSGKVLGLLALRIDPTRYLYPFILHWPTPTRSAESLLVGREGNDAVYLSDLRFRPGVALTLRAPLDRMDLPAAQAIRGTQGLVEGRDYRGVPVLADLRAVPGSPWFLVTRMDQAEVFANLGENLTGTLVLAAALVLATLGGAVAIWRHRRASDYRKQLLSEREGGWLKDAIARSLDEVYVLDARTLRFQFVNAGAARNLGYTAQELLTMSPLDLRPSMSLEAIHARIQPLVENPKEILAFQSLHRRKDGTEYPVEMRLQWVDHGGESVFLAVASDITERKLSEREVERLNWLVRESQSIAKVGGWEIDLVANTLYWTEETYHIHDTTPGDYAPTLETALGFYDAESLPRIQEAVQRSIEDGQPFDLELGLITAKGRRIRVHTTSRPIQQDGRTLKVVGAFRDITAEKEVQQHLLDAETRLRLAIEGGRMGIWDWNVQDNHMTWDERMMDLYGCSPSTFPGGVEAWKQGLHPHDAPRALEDCEAALRGDREYNTEFRILRPDGGVRWIKAAAQVLRGPDGSPLRMIGANWDITDQKRDAEALERAHFALEHLADPVFWVGKDGVFTEVNEAATLQLGYSREELLDLGVADIDPEFDPAQWGTFWNEMCRLGSVTHTTRHRRKDSSQFKVEVSINYIRFGEQEFLCGFARDLTGREHAEEQLRKSEAMLRSVIDASPVPFLLSNREGLITYLNPAFTRTFGYDHQDIQTMAQWWTEAYPDPHYRAWVMEHWQGRLDQAEREGTFIESQEVNIHCKDGSDRTILKSVAPLFGTFEGTELSVLYDITDRKQMEVEHRSLEGQFHHLQRMESIGRLAGGIAHDMNNVLASIMAVASLIQYQGGEGAKQAELILHASHRGRSLVKGLMEFARKEIQDAEFLDLNEMIRKEAELLANTTLKRIKVELDLAPRLPKLMGSATAISTALMNLCVNAMDAMPEGGTLTLRTALEQDGSLRLVVGDSGHGMSPEVLSRAMEPFYTTKPLGEGTGLGLAMVFGMVQAHNGTIDIQSQVGRGTEVHILLPIIPGEKRNTPILPPRPARGGLTGLRILLVDDDPLVRSTTLSLLNGLGHCILAVGSGTEALRAIESGDPWDMVVLDHNMPEMDGAETLRRLRLHHPDLPVVVATGFADAHLRRRLEGLARVVLLPKPYSLDELQEALGAMMALDSGDSKA